MNNKLKILLEKILKNEDIYFFTIDNLFNKIVVFSQKFIIEICLFNIGGYIKKSNLLFFRIRKFEDIDKIYNFVNQKIIITNNKNINAIINIIVKYEKVIFNLFQEGNKDFYNNTFHNINNNIQKKILLILKGGGMEETIEKSFISYCNYFKLKLTVLYKFGHGYWGQKLNQDGFFNELKANNKNINFLYKEDFDDNYIDSIIDNNTEIFSFQYDYKGKYKDINMIVLSSITDDEIDCSRYKNIFSCYESNSIGYSTDKFINTKNTNIYKIFNPQNIDLLNNFIIIKKIDNFILSGGMSWCRDFSILNNLNGKYKGILISDEIYDINNFLSMYRGIQNYYGFLGSFKLSKIGIFCHLEKYNNDDRSKMIATSICAGIPVIVPYNDGLIVKTIIQNNLGLTYENGNNLDLIEKVRFFMENEDNIIKYGKNCKDYSNQNMDIDKFINLIFQKTFI